MNMPTIAIVSQKGGSGKTTLAIHLATAATSAGKVACIVDTDPQATAAAWGDWRGGADPEVITAPPTRLGKTIEDAANLGAEVIVVDTPPHADAAAREAVKAADLVLIPTRPRAFDLHAIQTTAELIRYAGKPAFVVFNAAPARGAQLFAEASAIVENLGLKVCPITFADRAAFHHSVAAGKVATETDPQGKAASETAALWDWVCEQVGMTSRKRVNTRTKGKKA
jgi:chromosome partitioning protein